MEKHTLENAIFFFGIGFQTVNPGIYEQTCLRVAT